MGFVQGVRNMFDLNSRLFVFKYEITLFRLLLFFFLTGKLQTAVDWAVD